MLRQDYESDPIFYNKIYQKFTPAVKATEDGKEIGDKLSKLVKLVPGHEAPAIEGKLINGKAFDPKSMHKKIFLIDFWRAGNQVARINHAEIKTMLKDFGKSGFEVISVSMDTKKDWWTTAVDEDKITWTQVSDLKGDDSPNTQNWSVTRLPRYDLVDGNWQMIERDVSFGQVYLDVEQYLKKHR
jgi:peroxiredoxin